VTTTMLASVRPQLPDAIAGRLGPAGDTAILAIDTATGDAGELLFELQTRLEGRGKLVHGGIDRIQSRSVGRFFFSVPAGDVAAARQLLLSRLARVEVLGHV